MTNIYTAPVDRRSMATAAAIGGCVGLAIGSAYVAGALARASVDDARARLVAGAPAGGGEEAPLGRAQAITPAASMLAPSSPTKAALRGAAAPARDLECLSQAVYYEARGEEERGRRAVAQVVLNRMGRPHFPKSICGVVFQHAASGCAFSFTCDGQTRHPLEVAAWRDARRVAQRALAGFAMPELRMATDFRGGGSQPVGLARIAQIGGHVFYGGKRAERDARPSPPAPKPGDTAAPVVTLIKAEAPARPEAAGTTPAA